MILFAGNNLESGEYVLGVANDEVRGTPSIYKHIELKRSKETLSRGQTYNSEIVSRQARVRYLFP